MYDKLDALILDNVRKYGAATMLQATGREAAQEAHRIAENTGREAFRVSDGRLQALRKRGLIYHIRGAWHMANDGYRTPSTKRTQ